MSEGSSVTLTVDVPLPSFSATRSPEDWFRKVEKKFHSLRIANEHTHFRYVLLDEYDSRDRASYRVEGARILMRLRALGCLRPSQYLKKLASELGGYLRPDQLRQLWLSRLPLEYRASFEAADEVDTLDELVGMARSLEEESDSKGSLVRSVRTPIASVKVVEIEIGRVGGSRQLQLAATRDSWWRGLKDNAGKFLAAFAKLGATSIKLGRVFDSHPCRLVQCKLLVLE